MSGLSLKLALIEDLVDGSLLDDFDIPKTQIDDDILAWFASAISRLSEHRDVREVSLNQEIPAGASTEVDVILCPPEALTNLFELEDNILGCHNLTNPDCDPFKEGRPSASRHRILIGWDADAVRDHIFDPAFFDPQEGAMAWLITFTHELQHVVLFAENGSLNSPADLESLEDEIGRDLFDISSGYGIRPLKVDGREVWADDAEEAHSLMEAYVEERGRDMAEEVFEDDLSPGHLVAFLAPNAPAPR